MPTTKRQLKEQLSKLFLDLERKRGPFYTPLPTNQYMPSVYKIAVAKYVKQRNVFHYTDLYNRLKNIDPKNVPSHDVITAHLLHCGFQKKKVKIPNNKIMTLWCVKSN